VFLFDEPLSNLDAALRVQTRLEIAKLHHSMSNVTMIYVTHDQVEAMTLVTGSPCCATGGWNRRAARRSCTSARTRSSSRLHRQPEDELPDRHRRRPRLHHFGRPVGTYRRGRQRPLVGRGSARRGPGL
jgi:translation initiation factor RLI1